MLQASAALAMPEVLAQCGGSRWHSESLGATEVSTVTCPHSCCPALQLLNELFKLPPWRQPLPCCSCVTLLIRVPKFSSFSSFLASFGSQGCCESLQCSGRGFQCLQKLQPDWGLFGQDLRLFIRGFVSVRRALGGAKGSSAAGSGVWITAMDRAWSGRRM